MIGCINLDRNTSYGLIPYGILSLAESSDLVAASEKPNVANNLYHVYNISQISILNSHCPSPKHEGGNRNSSMFRSFSLKV